MASPIGIANMFLRQMPDPQAQQKNLLQQIALAERAQSNRLQQEDRGIAAEDRQTRLSDAETKRGYIQEDRGTAAEDRIRRIQNEGLDRAERADDRQFNRQSARATQGRAAATHANALTDRITRLQHEKEDRPYQKMANLQTLAKSQRGIRQDAEERKLALSAAHGNLMSGVANLDETNWDEWRRQLGVVSEMSGIDVSEIPMEFDAATVAEARQAAQARQAAAQEAEYAANDRISKKDLMKMAVAANRASFNPDIQGSYEQLSTIANPPQSQPQGQFILNKTYQDAAGNTATYKGKDQHGQDIWE